MAKFLSKAGLVLETNDADKIECYRAQGLVEIKQEPLPEQNVEVASDYVVRPAKKKGKKGE